MLGVMDRYRILQMVLVGCLAALSFMPVSLADELTDAILDVDPRVRLESAVGVAYGSIYSPQDESPTALEPLPGETPSLSGYEGYYEGLRSPLYEEDEDTSLESTPELSTSTELPTSTELSTLTTVAPLPLGKPEQREGVWYQDDLRSTPTP